MIYSGIHDEVQYSKIRRKLPTNEFLLTPNAHKVVCLIFEVRFVEKRKSLSAQSMSRFYRIHPPSSDLRCWDRLHLPFLEFRLRRKGGLPAVRQRCLQASVREPCHHSQGRRLPPLRHHMVLLTQELQEVHQRS